MDLHQEAGAGSPSSGQIQQEIDECRTLIGRRPESVAAHNNLGRLLLMCGQFPEAREVLVKAHALDPNDVPVWGNLAGALIETGDLPWAERLIDRALQATPEDPELHNKKGILLERQFNLPGAVAEYGEAVRLDSSHAQAHYNIAGIAAMRGEAELFVHHMKEAVRLKPQLREEAREDRHFEDVRESEQFREALA